MFWLYPGGLQFGDASRPIYDGSILAAYHDVIVVVPNFRSNVFGFSNSPELNLTSRNAGFYDQRLALEWVQENIAAFGGDPKRVTVFGNSAGGTSIDRLITTWPVDPPFQAAIIQSGQATFAPYHLTNGQASWSQLVDHFGCSGQSSAIACLREVPASDIKSYIEETGILFIPVTDNVTQLSAADARRARQARNVANVPLLIGSNGQEGSAFWRHAPADLDNFLRVFFAGDDELQRLVNLTYPLSPAGSATTYQRLASIFTDLVFTCPTSLLAASSASAGLPTWRYFYNASFPELAPLPGLGAYHTGEVPLVFGTYPQGNATPSALATSNFMQRVWTEFAKNPIAGPGWNKIGKMSPDDLAYMDETFSGVQLKNPRLMDSKCWIFKGVYERIEDPPWALKGNMHLQAPLDV
ncbi:hypothetical protein DL768_011334 [Monosporascus sp. mg162]|nr:hypothetical protein DL768_011334 [Monosporascus sp. mg162]